MIKRASALLLGLCLYASPALSESGDPGLSQTLTPFETGNDLVLECRNRTSMCYAYLLGLAVGMTEECTGWPSWTAEKLRTIVVRYGFTYPERLGEPRDTVAMGAITATFGCTHDGYIRREGARD
jgi:hypothetical protein